MLISFFLPFLSLSLSLLYSQNVLFAIGSAFLYYVNHFKLYSSFCASHSKAQKVLHPSKYKKKGKAMGKNQGKSVGNSTEAFI